MTDDLVLSHFYRHERGARIYDGADEVHKTVVAKLALKKAKGAVSLIDGTKPVRAGEELDLAGSGRVPWTTSRANSRWSSSREATRT